MKTLPKERLKELTDYQVRLAEAEERIISSVERFNEVMAGARTVLENEIGKYNGLIADARGMVEESEADVQNYFDERSEKWQGSEQGGRYQGWIDALSGLSLDEIEIEIPEPIEEPEFAARSVLDEEFQTELPG